MSETAQPGHTQISTQLLRGFFLACGVATLVTAFALLGDAHAIWPLVTIFLTQVFMMSMGTRALLRVYRLPSVALPRLFILNAAVASLCLCGLIAIHIATREFLSAGVFRRDTINTVAQMSSMIAAFATALLIYRVSLPIRWSHASVIALAIGCIALVSGAVLGVAMTLLAGEIVAQGMSELLDIFGPVIM
jgi:hypothetical protein